MIRRAGWTFLAVAGLAAASIGCDASTSATPSAAALASVSASVAPGSSPPTASEAGGATPGGTAEVTTLRTLIDAEPEQSTLVVEEELATELKFVTHAVSYESEGFTIRGVIRTPSGDGPFPGVVFVHGAVDPDTWSALEQNLDEQRRLVDAGYVVLVPDLRNHGESDDDPEYQIDLEMGTSADVVSAARALATHPDVDPERIAVIGSSFGGVMTFNAMVVAPEVADAFVVLAPGSLSMWENISHFLPPDSPAYQGLTGLRGTQESNPEFWSDVSAATFVDRAQRPLLIVQGTADTVVPPEWAAQSAATFEEAGKDVELVMIEGADHSFEPARDEAWEHVLDFLAMHLGG